VIAGLELGRVLAAFNGGFRLNVGVGGFESYGRVAAPLSDGLGSVVTYTDGTTDIGSWHQEVPAPGRTVASVRQNLPLLIDHGTAASTLACLSCWGATLGGVSDPARSALGIQADGHLVSAAAEHATVTDLADALLSAGVVRAVELDINPEWVAGYL
jgi:Phosphodiester glycosidase